MQNSANSTLTISGTITSNNNSIFYDGSGGTFNLSGNFGGSGVINQASDGTLILSGTNTYSGGAALTSGTLDINSSTALGLGSGTFYIYSGTMDNTSGAPITLTNNNAINIEGSFTFGGTNSLNLGAGAVTLNSASTITVSANTLTIGGAVGGSSALNKAGPGMLVLNGANTYNRATNVSAGKLQVNGSLSSASAVGVSSGAILSGTGTVGGTTTLNLGAILSPGNGGTGTLTVGSLLWDGASSATPTMEFTLSNSNNSSTAVNITGAFTKGSGSNFLFDFQNTGFFDGVDPTTYTLVDFGSDSGFSVGNFSYEDLPLYMKGNFDLTATSLQFVITEMVPEPGTWGLAAGVAALGVAVVRRRRQVKSIAA